MQKRIPLLTLLLMIVLAGSMTAQVLNSTVQNVNLSATLNESLTVTINSGATQNIASLTPGSVNAFPTQVNLTTNWVLRPSRAALALYTYFDSATAAMVHGDPLNTTDIPSGAIRAAFNGGAFNTISNTTPFGAANAGLQLFNVAIIGNNKSGTRTDNIDLQLDLSLTNVNGQDMTQLPADTYTGILHIAAQATP